MPFRFKDTPPPVDSLAGTLPADSTAEVPVRKFKFRDPSPAAAPAPTEASPPSGPGIMESIGQYFTDMAAVPRTAVEGTMRGAAESMDTAQAIGPKNYLRLVWHRIADTLQMPPTLADEYDLQQDIKDYVRAYGKNDRVIKLGKTIESNHQFISHMTPEVIRGEFNVLGLLGGYMAGKAVAASGPSLLSKTALNRTVARGVAGALAIETDAILGGAAAGLGEEAAKEEGSDPVAGALRGAAMGALAAPIGVGAAKALGFGLRTTGHVVGGALSGLRTLDGGLRLRVDAFDHVRTLMDNTMDRVWGSVGMKGETMLRSMKLDPMADALMAYRQESKLLFARWNTAVYGHVWGLTPLEQRALTHVLDNQALDAAGNKIADENLLYALAGENWPKVLERAQAIRKVFDEVAEQATSVNLLTHDAAHGTVYSFLPRKGYFPHMVRNSASLLPGGRDYDEAIKILTTRHGKTDAEAIDILARLHNDTQAEIKGFSRPGASHGRAFAIGRAYNLPGYNLDINTVAPLYFSTMAARIQAIKRWGNLPLGLRPANQSELNELAAQTQKALIAQADEAYKTATVRFNQAQEEVAAKIKTRRGLKRGPEMADVRSAVNEEIATSKAEVRRLEKLAKEAADILEQTKKNKTIPPLAGTPDPTTGMPVGQVVSTDDLLDVTANKVPTVETLTPSPLPETELGEKNLALSDIYPRAFSAFEEIEDKTNRDRARAIFTRVLGHDFGAAPIKGSLEDKAAMAMMSFNTITKLPLAAISQLTQLTTNPIMVTGLKNAGKDYIKLLKFAVTKDPETIRAIRATGALAGNVIAEAHAALTGGGRLAEAFLKNSGFTKLDKAARVYGVFRGWSMLNHAAEEWWIAKTAMKSAGKNELALLNAKIARLEDKFKILGINPEGLAANNGIPTKDMMNRAGLNMAMELNFWNDALSVPVFWTSYWGKFLTQFKSFIYQQSVLIDKHVVKPALKGDAGPLIRTLPAALASGEVVSDLRALAGGREIPDDDKERIVNDLANGAILSMLYEVDKALNDPWQLASWFLGPSPSTFVDYSVAAARMKEGDFSAISSRAAKDVTSAMGSKVPGIGYVAHHVKRAFAPRADELLEEDFGEE